MLLHPGRAVQASRLRQPSFHTAEPSAPDRRQIRMGCRLLWRLPVWVSAVEPGSVHGLTAAHEHALGALYAAATRGLPTLADPGHEGTGHGVYTQATRRRAPARRRQRTYNKLLRSMCCLGERGFALLTGRCWQRGMSGIFV